MNRASGTGLMAFGLVLVVVGAILDYAVTVTASGLNINTVTADESTLLSANRIRTPSHTRKNGVMGKYRAAFIGSAHGSCHMRAAAPPVQSFAAGRQRSEAGYRTSSASSASATAQASR